ncbi:MAG: class I SAM-dependent methyltransferase [Actinobacteria bacterium]|nr:class I SAM-dependent methyltransferase [Actinomycetota bacterium]MCL5883334.1 class I SAM-dependent methyltransferase [Actinomycetota bacterium]
MSGPVSCDLCGGTHHELLFVGHDRLFDIEGEFPLVRCQDCGLVFVNPRPSYEEMARFYPQDDYDLYNKAAGLKNRSMDELGRLQGPRKGRIEKFQKNGKLLDIGFGDGSFLYFMKECGWDVAGVDFNQKMVDLVRDELGIEAVAGQLEDAGYPDGAFDVVTLWGVLEHVQSPRQTVEEISRITADGALLVIYTQNAAAPEARWLGEDWFIYEVPRHLYSFTPDSLAKLLSSAGFCVAETVFETPLYYSQMNWQYFKERRLHRKNDVVHDPTMVDRLVTKALSFYRRAVNGGKKSSAMTVYAVKRESCAPASAGASASSQGSENINGKEDNAAQ